MMQPCADKSNFIFNMDSLAVKELLDSDSGAD